MFGANLTFLSRARGESSPPAPSPPPGYAPAVDSLSPPIMKKSVQP